MSHDRIKTTYQTQGAYGITKTHTLYARHNHCSDLVSFFYEDGELILTVEDTMQNNLFDAIERLYMPYVGEDFKLDPMVEQMDAEDRKKCGI